MARVADVDTQIKTGSAAVAYSRKSSVGEIAAGIRQIIDEGLSIDNNPSLREAAEYVLKLYGMSAGKDFQDNWVKIADYLGTRPNISIDEAEEELKQPQAETAEEPLPAEEEIKAKWMAFNSEDLKNLISEWEKYQSKEKTDSRGAVERFIKQLKANVPQFEAVKDGDLARMVVRMTETEAQLERKGQIEAEAVKTAEEITAAAETSETPKSCREKTTRILKEAGVDKESFEEIIEPVVVENAQKSVKEKVDAAVEDFTNNLADLGPTDEQAGKIGELLRERIEVKIVDPTRLIDEHEIFEPAGGGREAGNSLSDEIVGLLGKEGAADKTRVAVAIKNTEIGLKNSLFTGETNENNDIDIIRRASLKEEIVSRMSGVEAEEAKSMAEMVAGLAFPQRESSNSTALETAMEILDGSGHHGGDNPRLSEQALVWRNIFRSPGSIRENVDSILGASDKLKGIRGFEQLETVARTLKDNPGLMKMMELMQKVVGLQDSIGKAAGWMVNPAEALFRIPAVQRLAVQVATRFGGEAVGAMATQMAEFGLREGARRILGQLLQNGSVKIAELGIKLGAQTGTKLAGEAALDLGLDLGLTATVGGIPIAAVLLVIQLLQAAWELVKPVLNWVKDKWENLMEAVGIGSAKTKVWLQDQFGKFLGSVLYWGGMAAMGLLSLVGVAVGSAAIAGWVLVSVIGGLGVMQFSTANTVSSLVAPKGMGGASSGSLTSIPGSMVPASPIYDDKCLNSPAYCVVAYLLGNGVVYINSSNVDSVENLINQWRNAPSNFDKTVFNSYMASSVASYGIFECVAFAEAINPAIGSSGWNDNDAWWQGLLAHGTTNCPRIDPAGAGAGDFILMPSGNWYHIQVLSQLRPDGSFTISQANWTGHGDVSNVPGSNIQGYLSGRSVLRCH